MPAGLSGEWISLTPRGLLDLDTAPACCAVHIVRHAIRDGTPLARVHVVSRAAMVIPYTRISPEALRSLVEEFITRDGTDYGAVESSLDAKVADVMSQLEAGSAVVVYDPIEESASIVLRDGLRDA